MLESVYGLGRFAFGAGLIAAPAPFGTAGARNLMLRRPGPPRYEWASPTKEAG